MSNIELNEAQLKAISSMRNGCILCGGTGSGKSRTSLAYFYKTQGGKIFDDTRMSYPVNLYIITTARKRDEKEWEEEFSMFDFDSYDMNITIDSWNNIRKYQDVKNSFFIFDEQRVIGYGAWVKSFLKISKFNNWILLSATPGDTWLDYLPVFMANGYFRTKKEFLDDHAVFARYTNFPKIDRFINVRKLEQLRDMLLVDIPVERHTIQHHENIIVDFDREAVKQLIKMRWNPYTDYAVETAAELCYTNRRIVNSDISRQIKLLELSEKHSRMIVFYNYDYELEILRNMIFSPEFEIAEWNGHKHESVPTSENWVYFVQYTSGCEGWNCITCDTIVFFSLNYSHRVMEQAAGRIDRINTPYTDLYYYHMQSLASIDLSIKNSLHNKKKFNERKFAARIFKLPLREKVA